MQGSSRRWKRAVPFAMMMCLPLMAGCRTTASGGTDVSCAAFEPIGWSSADTTATQREVREHNAAWSALCKTGAATRSRDHSATKQN